MKKNIDVRPPELYLIFLGDETDIISVAPSCTNLADQAMCKILILENISGAQYEVFDYKERKTYSTVSNEIWDGCFGYKIHGEDYILGGAVYFKRLNSL